MAEASSRRRKDFYFLHFWLAYAVFCKLAGFDNLEVNTLRPIFLAVAVFIFGSAAQASSIYSTVTGPTPLKIEGLGNPQSHPEEFMGAMRLAGTEDTGTQITLILSEWSVSSDFLDPLWSLPLTLNLYNVNSTGSNPAPGARLTTQSGRGGSPYTPDADPTCPTAGAWRGSDGNCYTGMAVKIVFDISGTMLPGQFMFGVSAQPRTWNPPKPEKQETYESVNLDSVPETPSSNLGPPANGTQPLTLPDHYHGDKGSLPKQSLVTTGIQTLQLEAVAAIPEPLTLLLVGGGLLGLGMLRKRAG